MFFKRFLRKKLESGVSFNQTLKDVKAQRQRVVGGESYSMSS
ncbi:hypothetical protein [Mariniflexile sp.]